MSWLKYRCLLLIAIMLCGARFQAAAGQTRGTPAPNVCSCLDGRSFSVGDSLYAKNSTRIVVTNLTVGMYSSVATEESPRCESLLVVGQTVTQKNDAKGRPYLHRETVKRGSIGDICASQIIFKRPGKRNVLDEFEAELRGLEESSDSVVVDNEIPQFKLESDLDNSGSVKVQEENSVAGELSFNEQPFKEGAFVIIQKTHDNVHKGTLGRLDKLRGNVDRNIWSVDIWPDSLPRPFWRLIFGPWETNATVKKVTVPEQDLQEINELLDRLMVDTIHFGEGKKDAEKSPYQDVLDNYSRIVPLEQNLLNAAQDRAFDRISEVMSKLLFSPKTPSLFDQVGVVTLDELTSGKQADEAAPDLLHRQCFIDLRGSNAKDANANLKYGVQDVDVRVFKPTNSSQVSDSYYAVDLAFVVHSARGGASIPVICRLPQAIIGVEIVNMSIKILSQAFNIGPRSRE